MHALLLMWDLSEKSKEIFDTLRKYITNESWARYANKKGLCQKVWFSNPATGKFGGFYLWETQEDMEEEIRTMYRVESMTEVAPSIHRLDVEAIQKGKCSITDLTTIGLAWLKKDGI